MVDVEKMIDEEQDSQGEGRVKDFEEEKERDKGEWKKMTLRQKVNKTEHVTSTDLEATNPTKNHTKGKNSSA